MTALAAFLNSVFAIIGRLKSVAPAVNFNLTNNDNPITINLPTGYTRYKVDQVLISGASHTLVTATCGLFTAAGAAGTAIVASGSAITVSATADNTNNNLQTVAMFANNPTTSFNAATLYFRTQTPEGAAAVADVTVVYTPLP